MQDAIAIQKLSDKLDAVAGDVKECRRLLSGNEDPAKGLVVRVDRIEQNETRRAWWTRTAVGASIVALVGAAARYVRHS